MLLQQHHLLSSTLTSPLYLRLHTPHSTSLSSILPTSLTKPASLHGVSALPRPKPLQPRLAQLPEPEPTSTDGPIELPPSEPSIFSTFDGNSPLQAASSVLLTGAITVFLFRAVRRRAKRAKELRFRSSTAKKTLKEEALDSLKAMRPAPVPENSPPSAVQAFVGALTAGIIGLVLYKFTTTVEGGLNRQTLSDSYSVRQITITVRTIINGLCYLATFVFGINSFGLFLYSAQLAFNSLMATSTDDDEQSNLSNTEEKSSNSDLSTSDTNQSFEDRSK